MYHNLTFLETKTTNYVTYVKNIIRDVIPQGLTFIKNLFFAILIFYIGKKLIKYVTHLLEKYFNKTKMEASVSGFLVALIKALCYILLVTNIIVNILGVQESSFVALIGSAGLSIGLALQGGLSNFAGGILILLLKPFRVGDYIIAGGNEGTVTTIDIFYTRLVTFDNKVLVMPNGTLSNNNIMNVTNEPFRRLDLLIPISFNENIEKVKDILLNILNDNDMVLKDHEINVFVNNFDPSSISIGIRVWVLNENYWTLKWNLLENIKKDFDMNVIKIPYNQLDVNINNR